MNRRDILKHFSAAPFFTMFINKRKAWAGSTIDLAPIVDEAAPPMEKPIEKPGEPSILNNFNVDPKIQLCLDLRAALTTALGYITLRLELKEPDKAEAFTLGCLEKALKKVDMLQFTYLMPPAVRKRLLPDEDH